MNSNIIGTLTHNCKIILIIIIHNEFVAPVVIAPFVVVYYIGAKKYQIIITLLLFTLKLLNTNLINPQKSLKKGR